MYQRLQLRGSGAYRNSRQRSGPRRQTEARVTHAQHKHQAAIEPSPQLPPHRPDATDTIDPLAITRASSAPAASRKGRRRVGCVRSPGRSALSDQRWLACAGLLRLRLCRRRAAGATLLRLAARGLRVLASARGRGVGRGLRLGRGRRCGSSGAEAGWLRLGGSCAARAGSRVGRDGGRLGAASGCGWRPPWQAPRGRNQGDETKRARPRVDEPVTHHLLRPVHCAQWSLGLQMVNPP